MSRPCEPTVAVVGVGLIGRAWAIAFARAGWQVRLWDEAPAAPAEAMRLIAGLVTDLEAEAMLPEASAASVLSRLSVAGSLGDALADAGWAQESVPEDLEVKRELWRELDRLAAPLTLLASSTSSIVPSAFTEHLAGRGRCLTCHPLNPPYLVPAVELVPSPWTEDATMARAEAVMRGIGQSPIVMARELDGFVMNRLQGALLEEAFRLVEGGHCAPEDVDVALRDGLALRWSFMGPFETIDLNAPAGVGDYVRRYQHIYERLFPSMRHRADWAGPVLGVIEARRRERLPAERLTERQRWRDRRLMMLLRHKREAAREIGG